MITIKKRFVFAHVFLSLLVVFYGVQPALAEEIDSGYQGPTMSDEYTEHGIDYFSNATAQCEVGSAPAIASNPTDEEGGLKNEDYAGNQIWTDEELALIDQHKATYMEAAQEANVPWAMLAVIHKRESSLRLTYNSNGQGIYQFYEMAGQFPRSGEASPAQFLRETKMLANQLQDDYVNRNHTSNAGPLSAGGTADNVIQDTFFSYNGRASVYVNQARSLGFSGEGEGFNGSPYVMNKADAKRDPNVAPSGTWGQVKVDNGGIAYPANQDYGAWVYYAALAGIGGSCSHGSGPTVQKEIGGVMYAWPIAPGQKKADHAGLLSDLPCNNAAGCHYGAGTDPAFDMTRAPGGNAAVGTEVYAVTDGRILWVSEPYNGQVGCQSIQFESVDGYKYWYGHIKEAVVADKQDVSVGDPFAILGESRCSCPNCSAPPHLHIDRGAPKGETGGSTRAGARDRGFVDIINQLFEIME